MLAKKMHQLPLMASVVCICSWQVLASAQPLHYMDLIGEPGVPWRTFVNCTLPGKTERVQESFSYKERHRVLDFCVVPSSFVLSENGGRVQIITAFAAGSSEYGNQYRAWFLEVDCKKMESRSANDWSLDKDEPDDKAKLLRRYTYFSNPGLWLSSQNRSAWTGWEPVTNLDKKTKWICRKWKGSSKGSQWSN